MEPIGSSPARRVGARVRFHDEPNLDILAPNDKRHVKTADLARTTKQIAEAYIVASARLGDRVARTQLVERYQTRFLRHAYRLLDDVEQAKDAVQDAWLEVMRGLPQLRDDMAFRAWAFRVVTRRCARIITKQKRTRDIAELIANEPVTNCEAVCALEMAESQSRLRKALAVLSPEHRATIALFYLEEMSVAEVAVALDIPVGTVKSRLLNARAKLRATLARR